MILRILLLLSIITTTRLVAASDETVTVSAATTTTHDCVMADDGTCLYQDVPVDDDDDEDEYNDEYDGDEEDKDDEDEEFIWDANQEFIYHEDMSLLNVLNPDLLRNVTLWQEISERLQKHDLIMLRDAFKPEFADYVWEELYRDDLEWPHWDAWQEDGFTYSHHNFYDPEVCGKIGGDKGCRYLHVAMYESIEKWRHGTISLCGNSCSLPFFINILFFFFQFFVSHLF